MTRHNGVLFGSLLIVGAALVAGGAGALAAGGPARLLADINQVPSHERGSFPEEITPVGTWSIFRAQTRATGVEIWRTDGTEAGTRLIKDVLPGPSSGSRYYGDRSTGTPLDPAVLDDVAYFLGNDGVHGWELWRTDGSAAGTFMVRDIKPGAPSGFEQGSSYEHRNLIWKHFVIGGQVLFLADDGVHGQELWRTDGTEAGTFLFKEIMPGTGGAFGTVYQMQLSSFAAAFSGDLLYFTANDGITGMELWKTDGTPAGTVRVRDINPGADGSLPSRMVDLNGILIFMASEPRTGSEIWRSDGTFAGTTLVREVFSGTFGFSPDRLLRVGDLIYFGAYQHLYRTDGTFPGTVLLRSFSTGYVVPMGALGYEVVVLADDRDHGFELWLSDGTPARTRLLKDIRPGTFSSSPYQPVEVEGRLYFLADDGTHGREIWTSDGTDAGTQLLVDLNPGAAQSSIYGLHRVGGRCLFSHYTQGLGRLYASDGTVAGTVALGDLSVDFIDVGPGVPGLLSANDGIHGFELWRTDGTPGGTALVKDLEPNFRTDGSWATWLATLAEPGSPTRVLFSAEDGVHGSEPWITDGTAAGTRLLRDLTRGQGWGNIYDAIAYHGAFYFLATAEEPGWALWRTDGTEAGTVPAIEAGHGPVPDLGSPLLEFKDRLYYFSWDALHGRELWRSDGTADGSELVADLNPGPADTWSEAVLVVGDTLFLSVYTDAYGYELWKSDGTSAGTAIVKDIVPGPGSSIPTYLTRLGDRVVMTADDDTGQGRELWVSDGTEAGTILLKDINPGPAYGAGTFGLSRAVADGSLYFMGVDLEHGSELWKTDGTPEGTVLVKDVVPGPRHGYLEALTAFKGELYFGVRGFPYDDQLWKSDGTEAGTVPVKLGFILGAQGLRVVGDRLIFSGNDFYVHGRELWRSDGTEAGTGMLQDLNPGSGDSDPRGLVIAGSRVFFLADDGTSGTEPWVARAAILAGDPRQGILDLADEVRALGLPKGEETSLLAKLNAARDDARPAQAAIALEVFAHYVEMLAPRRLSEATAADLRQFAGEIVALLEAAPRSRGPKPKAAAPRTTGRPAGVTALPIPVGGP